MCFSYFLKSKDETGHKIMCLVEGFKECFDIKVQTLRCDNAGENKFTQTCCKDAGLGVKFEFTAPNTPQQNGRVERKFATLYGRIRAMMNAAGLTQSLKNGLWAEAANKATKDENMKVLPGSTKPAYEAFLWERKSTSMAYEDIWRNGCRNQGIQDPRKTWSTKERLSCLLDALQIIHLIRIGSTTWTPKGSVCLGMLDGLTNHMQHGVAVTMTILGM